MSHLFWSCRSSVTSDDHLHCIPALCQQESPPTCRSVGV